MRRLQPRIEFGMTKVVPTMVNTVKGIGSSAAEAAQVTTESKTAILTLATPTYTPLTTTFQTTLQQP